MLGAVAPGGPMIQVLHSLAAMLRPYSHGSDPLDAVSACSTLSVRASRCKLLLMPDGLPRRPIC